MQSKTIKELNLKRTKLNIGNSFYQGLFIYIWPNAIKGYKTLLSDCDKYGNPLPGNFKYLLMVARDGVQPEIEVDVSEEFLLMDETVREDFLYYLINR